jgi:L-ribulose-5-phosphate 4-epimerase
MRGKRETLEIRKKLAQACRILYMEGLADFNLGHASSRVPDQENICIKPRGLGLEEAKPEDLIVVDMEGNLLEGDHPLHGETPIHTEIYKMRRNVGGIVHVHPIFSTAFSAVRSEMKPLNQDGVLFLHGIPTLETPELITTKQQGQALAQRLGKGNALFLRNHGIVTVGNRLEEACLNALFLERALRVKLIASVFGEVEAIPEETAVKMYAECQNPKRYDMIWHYLVRKLEREGLGFE